MFHAKALEMYTQCYQSMAMMDEDQDLEVRPRSDKCGVTSADIHVRLSYGKQVVWSLYADVLPGEQRSMIVFSFPKRMS